MKKLFIVQCLLTLNLFCSESIMDFDAIKHTARVIEIGMESPEKFFPGYTKAAAMLTENVALEMYKGEFASSFKDSNRITKVLVLDEQVIGFVVVRKTTELNLEDLKVQCESIGQEFNAEMFLAITPDIKKTKAESEEYILLESIAISEKYRGKGFGKKLIKIVEQVIQEHYKDLHKIVLDVDNNNVQAIKLYESQGYTKSTMQPSHLVMMNATQFEKTI